jgi:hypothetical protein
MTSTRRDGVASSLVAAVAVSTSRSTSEGQAFMGEFAASTDPAAVADGDERAVPRRPATGRARRALR